MQWPTKHLEEPNREVVLLTDDIGALLVGANTPSVDDPNAGTAKEGAFGGDYSGPVVVLTHDPPEADDAKESAGQGIRFVNDLGSAVALSTGLAGDSPCINVFGADVARERTLRFELVRD